MRASVTGRDIDRTLKPLECGLALTVHLLDSGKQSKHTRVLWVQSKRTLGKLSSGPKMSLGKRDAGCRTQRQGGFRIHRKCDSCLVLGSMKTPGLKQCQGKQTMCGSAVRFVGKDSPESLDSERAVSVAQQDFNSN